MNKKEPYEPFHNLYVVQELRTTDFEALKLGKGSSGSHKRAVTEVLNFSPYFPTEHFAILEPQNQLIDVCVLNKFVGRYILRRNSPVR